MLCKPEDSWEHVGFILIWPILTCQFDELIGNSEEFFQSLKIPYQVVSM